MKLFSLSLLLLFVSLSSAAASGAFNLEVHILETHQTLEPGETLYFTTKTLNLQNQERVDITLQYVILQGNETITSKTETVAMETQASFVGEISLPKDLSEGQYILQTWLIYQGKREARGESQFKVESLTTWKEEIRTYQIPLSILGTIILVALLIIISRKKITLLKNHLRIKSNITEIIHKKLASHQVEEKELKNSRIKEKRITIDEEEKFY